MVILHGARVNCYSRAKAAVRKGLQPFWCKKGDLFSKEGASRAAFGLFGTERPDVKIRIMVSANLGFWPGEPDKSCFSRTM
jgi:hypothetical protein